MAIVDKIFTVEQRGIGRPDYSASISQIKHGEAYPTLEPLVSIFNTPLPAAYTNILATDITPTRTISWPRLYVVMEVEGLLFLRRTVGGVTISEDINDGWTLCAGCFYGFTFGWRAGDSLNLWYSATGGNILLLRIDETDMPP